MYKKFKVYAERYIIVYWTTQMKECYPFAGPFFLEIKSIKYLYICPLWKKSKKLNKSVRLVMKYFCILRELRYDCMLKPMDDFF